jgi:hypothetical protein
MLISINFDSIGSIINVNVHGVHKIKQHMKGYKAFIILPLLRYTDTTLWLKTSKQTG